MSQSQTKAQLFVISLRLNVKTHQTGQYKALKAGDSDLDNLRAVN